MSRKAAGKGRAVLEGLGLNAATITTCIKDNPQDVEEAVQVGIIKWLHGSGVQPPTWAKLLEAMDYARIGQQHIKELKEELSL